MEAQCFLCRKKFKNKHSLGVHQARYHPKHLNNHGLEIQGVNISNFRRELSMPSHFSNNFLLFHELKYNELTNLIKL